VASRALGAVASGHREVSEAAALALRDGGNAFDAVIAAGFAACVAEPMFASLGGGGFLLAREAQGEAVLFDFFVDAPGRGLAAAELEPHFEPIAVRFPASEQVFNVGRGSVAVPGALRGLLESHGELGRLPLSVVVAPAVVLARAGVVLNAHQAYVQELLTPIVTQSAAGRAIYAPGGETRNEGERVVNADLASFLESLPGAAEDFYTGTLAGLMADDMRSGQGLLGLEDLAAYRVARRAPFSFPYRGCRVLTNPPPAVGGALLARAFEAWAGRPDSGWDSVERRLRLAEVMAQVERERVPPATGGTTHVSVADGAGNVASLSLSNGEGSGYVAPGTGIMLNNMLGEDDLHPGGFHVQPPGTRVGSMMAPTLVLEGDSVRLVIGSGGSKRIRGAILQVMTGVLDAGLSLGAAVEAPRQHWDGEQLQLEPGIAPEVVAALGERWRVNPWNERNLYFGGVHAVVPGVEAAADPRREGAARVVSGTTAETPGP